MSWAFVQLAQNGNQNYFSMPAVQLFGTPTTTGNTVLALVQSAGNQPTSAADATGTNVYTLAASIHRPSNNGPAQWLSAWYCVNAQSTTDIEIQYAGGFSFSTYITAVEYSGISSFEVASINFDDTGASPTATSSVTTSGTNELLVGFSSLAYGSGGSGSATIRYSDASFTVTEDYNLATPGTYAATATARAGGWIMAALAFIPSGGVSRAMAAAIVGTATIVDFGRVARPIASGVVGRATLVDTASVARPLADAIVGRATEVDTASVARAMMSGIVGHATEVDAASVARPMSDAIVGTSHVSATLFVPVGMAASIVGRGALTGSMSFTKGFAAALLGRASVVDMASIARAFGLSVDAFARIVATLPGTIPSNPIQIFSPVVSAIPVFSPNVTPIQVIQP